jgi:hypothetical protein
MLRFDCPEFLLQGNSFQKNTYHALMDIKLFEELKAFNPVVVGSIPIDIHIPGSDCDIICEVYDHEKFERTLQQSFSRCYGFQLTRKFIRGTPSSIARFRLNDLPVEIFGQAYPVQEQYAFRHMIIEHRILEEKGDDFKNAIIRLKQQGWKTEPAFAQLMGLSGDPYEALLRYDPD